MKQLETGWGQTPPVGAEWACSAEAHAGGGGVQKGAQKIVYQQWPGKITLQRLLGQSQAGVYRGKRHIPPHFGSIRIHYPKGLNC